jgi:hypothetical protein
MQPLAIYALATGVVMILGASVTLVRTRHPVRPRRTALSRWHMHGSIPLAGAAVAIGAISLSSGQSPVTHTVIYLVTATLLLAAFVCALAGATAASRR